MANEISVERTSGLNVYAVISNASGQRWNTATPAFEAHNDAHWTDYDVVLTEQGNSGTYVGSFPAGIVAAVGYRITAYERDAGAPSLNDVKIAAGIFNWDGSAEIITERVYHASIELTRDNINQRDEYTVRFLRDLVRLTAGITTPTIQLVKRADGTDLLAETALSQIGATGAYKYDATAASRLTNGEAAIAVVRATIDGQTRTMERMVGRDL